MNIRIALAMTAIVFVGVSQTVCAVSLIEQKQADGSIEKTYVDGLRVRIESSQESGYVLIDGAEGTMVIVSPEEKQIVDMSHVLGDGKAKSGPGLKIEMVKKGNGPTIAGYATSHYEIQVNGRKCAEEYLSKKMPDDLGIQKTFEVVTAMFSQPDMDAMSGMDDCMKADEQIAPLYGKYGYPMRTLDADGRLESEVVNVRKKADMPAGGFTLPEGYQRVDMGQMMQGMPEMTPEGLHSMNPEQQKQMQQMMENMMQQMRPSRE